MLQANAFEVVGIEVHVMTCASSLFWAPTLFGPARSGDS